MKQFYILGASSAYGVGGENGGWADLLKLRIHQKMYGKDGVGEKYEVFNFAQSGATVDFVLNTFPQQVNNYKRPNDEVTILVSIGGNNAKAHGEPDNYVSTIDEYVRQMTTLFELLKANSSNVIVVGGGYVDESKTNPKISPFDGSKSYFTNSRRIEFRNALKKLCIEMSVDLVEPGLSIEEWQAKCLYIDGLHPNDEGHKLIFEAVLEKISL